MGTLSVDNIEERSTGKSQNSLSGQAKAWSNLNGTGTIAERDSFSVSSVTDNGTGLYTFTASSAFSSDGYSVTSMSGFSPADLGTALYLASTSSAFNTSTRRFAASETDPAILGVSAHGDLA